MLMLLGICLILSCSSMGMDSSFDADWKMMDNEKGEPMACLSLQDTLRLRGKLNQCKDDHD